MPSRERLSSFLEAVVQGRFLEALRDYYCDDAVVRENNGAERIGLPLLMEAEQATLDAFSVRTHQPTTVLLDGDDVAIHWTFDMTDQSGTVRRMEEIAIQRWAGDRIARERFFYDPALPVVTAEMPDRMETTSSAIIGCQ